MVKNILTYSLFCFSLIFCMMIVDAKSYTQYKTGDKITVKVNDSTNLDFYVMEDKNDMVVAIYEDVLDDLLAFGASDDGYEASDVQKKLNDLTSTWSNVISRRLIKADEIISGIDLSNNYSKEFKTPSYLCNGKNYWLMDTYKDTVTSNIIPFSVTAWNNYCLLSTNVDGENVNTKSYIRPVITVLKENIIGGIILTEDDQIFERFIKEFKKSEFIENSTLDMDITSTSNTFKIEIKDNTNNWTVNFTYSNGILTLIPSKSAESKLMDSYVTYGVLEALSTIKNYDLEKVIYWLDESDDFKLALDGVEFSLAKTEIIDSYDKLTVDMLDSFKLDIKNGLKTFKSQNENVSNPNTGKNNLNIILIIMFTISILLYLLIRKRSKFQKSV